MFPIVLTIAVSILGLNLCWLCLHLRRRVRSLEMSRRDHEQRIEWCELLGSSVPDSRRMRREFDAD